ncbi:Tn3 family transposase [Streptomyces sp. NPDC058424]|uniref:Tn3 family transposase n=1 Tax=Streptomyces sp. NPDC058424 TaxID=3346491 RepID=UPI00365667AC
MSAVAAGEHGHSEEELRYTALRYLAAASLKAAGGEIANATFAARQGTVWSQGTTVASGSHPPARGTQDRGAAGGAAGCLGVSQAAPG